jgi:methyl-accepting chemotaxis protein
MSIRRKLQILTWVTIVGLAVALFATISGLGAVHDAETTALRRESYSLQLVEIKASAASTIMLDPTRKESDEIFTGTEQKISGLADKAISTIKRPAIRDELKQIINQWSLYDRASRELMQLARHDAKAANDKLVPLYNSQFKPFQQALEKFINDRLVEAEQSRAEAQRIDGRVYWAIILLLIGVAVVNIGLVVALSVSLQKSLHGILEKIAQLHQGDLRARLPAAGKDELSQIAQNVNDFTSEMQRIIQGVHNTSAEVSSSASQLADSARLVAVDSASQSDSAASTAAAIEEMSVSVASIAETTGEVRRLSNASLDDAQKGNQSLSELQHEITEVQVAVEGIATHVRDFVSSTNAIAGMTQQIREIADQTNLLALNAAIEAARAGEQGRGFAVVADEVRKLAERASGSAGEITLVTAELHNKSTQVDQSVDGGLRSLATSLEFVTRLSKILGHTSQSVQKTTAGVDDVSASVHEQKEASAEIARNVELIAQMAEHNRAASHESSQASVRLEQLAVALNQLVDHFKV